MEKKPFHLTIVGATATGKTHYLLKMLEEEFKNHFNTIWLICPTFFKNVVEASQEHGTYKDGNNNLLILDDVASGLAVKNGNGALVESAFGSRHDGLSVVALTQQFKNVAKAWRDNQSHFVLFYNPNKKDMDEMFETLLGHTTREERKEIIRTLNTIPFSRLEIKLIPPPVTYKLVKPS